MEEQIAGLDSNKDSLREVCDWLFRQLARDHKRLESGLTQMNDMEELLLSCQEELTKAEGQVKTPKGQVLDCLWEKEEELEEDKQRVFSESWSL